MMEEAWKFETDRNEQNVGGKYVLEKEAGIMPKVRLPIASICLLPILFLAGGLKTFTSSSPPFHSKDLDLRLA